MKSSTGTDAFLPGADVAGTVDRTTLEQTFDRLMADNGPALSRLAYSYTNTASDRDDLLQDIALAIWQALPGFRAECSQRTFLFRIAHNRAIAHLVRTRSRLPLLDDEVDPPDSAPDPETGLAHEQTVDRLRNAIRRLSVPYRQVITLTLEGLGYAEIAEVLGISETNVGARLTRARQTLRDLLEKRK